MMTETKTIEQDSFIMDNYLVLREQLQEISSDWDKQQYLDPTHISVYLRGDWRKAKKLGCKKEYNGWVFFHTSTNSAGYELFEKIERLTSSFDDLVVYQRQL